MSLQIVEAAIEVNSHRKLTMAERIDEKLAGGVEGKKIAVFGLTFKGQTDDMRESPSIDIVNKLVSMGAQISAYDPAAPLSSLDLMPGIQMTQSALLAAEDTDAILILTDWKDFLHLDHSTLANVMRDPVMFDLRNMFEEQDVIKGGFNKYHSLGRLPKVTMLCHTEKVSDPENTNDWVAGDSKISVRQFRTAAKQ